jgi:hypothetical protein
METGWKRRRKVLARKLTPIIPQIADGVMPCAHKHYVSSPRRITMGLPMALRDNGEKDDGRPVCLAPMGATALHLRIHETLLV